MSIRSIFAHSHAQHVCWFSGRIRFCEWMRTDQINAAECLPFIYLFCPESGMRCVWFVHSFGTRFAYKKRCPADVFFCDEFADICGAQKSHNLCAVCSCSLIWVVYVYVDWMRSLWQCWTASYGMWCCSPSPMTGHICSVCKIYRTYSVSIDLHNINSLATQSICIVSVRGRLV